jgi:hypothetical protein
MECEDFLAVAWQHEMEHLAHYYLKIFFLVNLRKYSFGLFGFYQTVYCFQ